MRTGARPAESRSLLRTFPEPASRSTWDPFGGLEVHLERRLATGRMTEVWFGCAGDGHPRAIKTLKPDWLAKPGTRARLQREYELLGSLSHPRIVSAEAFIDEPDCAAIVCEYLGGGDLVSLAGAPPRYWIAAVRDVLSAIEYLHDRGLAHRDVKARNVMFDGEGRARLIDLGSTARIGTAWTHHGTTAAHRPGEPPSGRVGAEQDLYAFVVLLCELLSGRLPFEQEPGADAGADTPWLTFETKGRLELAAQCKDSPELAALRRLVLAALASGGGPGIGSVSQFSNVIESVLASESEQP